MKKYTPSGMEIDMTRDETGKIYVNSNVPPRNYNSIEDYLKGKYEAICEILEVAIELDIKKTKANSSNWMGKESVHPENVKTGTNHFQSAESAKVNYDLKGGIWIASTVHRAISKGGGNIEVKVKYFADGTISGLYAQADNSPIDTSILNPMIYGVAMQYIKAVKSDLDKLRSDSPQIKQRLDFLINDNEAETDIAIPIHVGSDILSENNTLKSGINSFIKYNPSNNLYGETGKMRTPRIGLAHELLGHAYNNTTRTNVNIDKTDPATRIDGDPKTSIPIGEEYAIYWENVERAALGEEQRMTWTSSYTDRPNYSYRLPHKYIIKNKAGNLNKDSKK